METYIGKEGRMNENIHELRKFSVYRDSVELSIFHLILFLILILIRLNVLILANSNRRLSLYLLIAKFQFDYVLSRMLMRIYDRIYSVYSWVE